MYWNALSGSAMSFAIANHLKEREGFVLTRQENEAETVAREMAYFRPDMSSRIVYVPDSETLPFDLERPSASIMSQRAFELSRLAGGSIQKPIIVSCVRNAMRLFAGSDFWKSHLTFELGAKINDDIASVFESWGYSPAFRTKSPGQYSIRGKVIDVYPIGGIREQSRFSHSALRIRLNDQREINQIKKLDALTQESSGSFSRCVVYPNRDYPIDKSIIEGFRRGSYEHHDDPRSTSVYKEVSQGSDHPELAWWVSDSAVGSISLLDMVEKPSFVILPGAREACEEFNQLISIRHQEVLADVTRIVPAIEKAFLPCSTLLQRISKAATVEISDKPEPGAVNFGYTESGMRRMASLQESLKALQALIKSHGDTLFVIKSQVREKHMRVMANMLGYRATLVEGFDDFLEQSRTPSDVNRIYISMGDLAHGHASEKNNYRLITEREIFGSVIETSLENELNEHQRRIILQGLHEIEPGEPLVHALNGVGRFAGFERINMQGLHGTEEDVVRVAYADNAMAFVRIRDLDLVSRYSGGSPEKAPLSKLNDQSWMMGIREAQHSAFSVAADLVKIRTIRENAVGISLKPADSHYDRFCEVFVYEETPDQLRAIQDIIADLTSGKPMDRLVCGDVGFGKTEVAMRAAFLAAHQGYQVVVLAPTTILAEQHFNSFVSRFEETSIKIKLANRNSLSRGDLDEIKSGDASIIIGTHRLLQGDIEFKSLGLIIVDEEHRFGVKQKEMLRSLRGNRHMLTLTATPIPRTLGMAISGIRDLSIIATPPARRLSVRTLVREFTDSSLKIAMTRELSRNGQIFYLHNVIDTMDQCVKRLQSLMPDARIGILHGRMSEAEMTKTMFAFRRHEFDILVSTTVIEIGIDVPNANTLIVEDADNLGLAQLHQLRGRVGRSSRQAYAYLLHKPKSSQTGMLRLKAMEKASNLGEGVMIARHDMEIRGIGEILGEEQSGHVHNIGFTLYMRLLEQAVRAMEDGSASAERAIMLNNVEMPIEGRIPHQFIAETGERLAWYQRLMSSESRDELDMHLSELEDLYGYLPDEIHTLKESVYKHIALRKWGIRRIEQDGDDVIITLHEDAPTQTNIMLGIMFPGLALADRKHQLLLESDKVDRVIDVLVSKSTR